MNWNIVKDIPGFVYSIIGLVILVATGLTYFATRDQLEEARCLSVVSSARNEAQITQLVEIRKNHYLKSLATPLVEKEKSGSLNSAEKESLTQLRADNELSRKRREAAQDMGLRLDEALRNHAIWRDGKCII